MSLTRSTPGAIKATIKTGQSGRYQIKLLINQGVLIQTQARQLQEGFNSLRLRLHNQASSIYFLTIRGDGEQINEQVLVK